MIILDYTVTATSRVSVGNGPAVVNDRPLQETLPGSSIRGALATAYAIDTGMSWREPSEAFLQAFEQSITFGPAMPGGRHIEPLSRVSCKYPVNSQCRAASTDVAAVTLAGGSIPTTCPECDRPWELGKGGLVDDTEPLLPQIGTRGTVSTTRAALDSDGVAVDGQLFTRRALVEGVRCRGRLVAHPTAPTEVVDWLTREQRIRVGGQRSVLGAMTWSASRSTPDSAQTPSRAILRCISPLILVDRYGAPTLDPADEFRQRLDGARILARWTRPVRVSGWHAAAGLPKPEDWAISAGAAFLMDGLPPDTGQRLLAGLGLRTVEGFGQLDLDVPSASAPNPTHQDAPQVQPSLPDAEPAASMDRPQSHIQDDAADRDPCQAHAEALCAGITGAPTEELRRRLRQAVFEGLGQIMKLRRLARDDKARRATAALLDRPVVRQHLGTTARESLTWVLTCADDHQQQTVRNRIGDLP